MDILVNVLGWTGAVAVLVAYFLVTTVRVNGASYTFQGLNLYGALGLMSVSLYYHVIPNVFLNAVWGVVGVGSIWSIWRQHRRWLANRPDEILCDYCGHTFVPNGIGNHCVPVEDW